MISNIFGYNSINIFFLSFSLLLNISLFIIIKNLSYFIFEFIFLPVLKIQKPKFGVFPFFLLPFLNIKFDFVSLIYLLKFIFFIKAVEIYIIKDIVLLKDKTIGSVSFCFSLSLSLSFSLSLIIDSIFSSNCFGSSKSKFFTFSLKI